MRKPRFALLFFVVLVLGLSLTVPAADLTETAYDESDALPYEGTPLISDVMTQAAASATEVERDALRRQLAAPFRVALRRSKGTDVRRSAEAPVALALLCTFLC
jgi:hypothetical protein